MGHLALRSGFEQVQMHPQVVHQQYDQVLISDEFITFPTPASGESKQLHNIDSIIISPQNSSMTSPMAPKGQECCKTSLHIVELWEFLRMPLFSESISADGKFLK